MPASRPLLIVEDSDEDYEVTCWALKRAGVDRAIVRCASADEALGRLLPDDAASDVSMPPPVLVLLDLNLPGGDGRSVLAGLNNSGRRPAVPVVILTTSNNPRDVADCYRLGAAGYLCKPHDLPTFVEKLRGFAIYWFNTAILPGGA
jgi:CheY-like chemotaxis protein